MNNHFAMNYFIRTGYNLFITAKIIIYFQNLFWIIIGVKGIETFSIQLRVVYRFFSTGCRTIGKNTQSFRKFNIRCRDTGIFQYTDNRPVISEFIAPCLLQSRNKTLCYKALAVSISIKYYYRHISQCHETFCQQLFFIIFAISLINKFSCKRYSFFIIKVCAGIIKTGCSA